MKDFRDFNTFEMKAILRAAPRRMPVTGSMELLPLCNMNCDMCYVRLSRREMEEKGRMRTGAEWLALGREMAKAGVLYLQLTGGEPLLHPDFKEIYLGLRKLGMILTVNTNATLIDEEWAAFFGKYKPRGMHVTLYGTDNATYERLCHYPGGFDRVTQAVRLLRQNEITVRLGFSMTPENVRDLDKLYEIAKGLDVVVQADTYMLPAVRERSLPFNRQSRLEPEAAAAAFVRSMRIEKGAEEFAGYRGRMLALVDAFVPGEKQPCAGECLAAKCSCSINWQGVMRPCVISTEPAAHAFDDGFEDAWKKVVAGFDAIRFSADCSVCRLRPLCPVCPVSTLIETGNYMDRPEYLCRYTGEIERLLRAYQEEEHE